MVKKTTTPRVKKVSSTPRKRSVALVAEVASKKSSWRGALGMAVLAVVLIAGVSAKTTLWGPVSTTQGAVAQTSALRDAGRKQDLAELKVALEAYYKNNGTYQVANSGWNGGSQGWVSLEDGGSYVRSTTRALKELGLLARADYKDPQQGGTGYMMYLCDGGKSFSLSATLEQGTSAEKTEAEGSCNGIGGNGTVPRYGKNYSVSGGGLVGEWKFDEGSGVSVIDSSGKSNNGTIQGQTTRLRGVIGTALKFNGVENFVQIPDSASLQTVEKLSVSAWINPTAFAPYFGGYKTNTRIVDKVTAGTGDGWLLDELDGKLRFAVGSAGSIKSTATLPLNTWTHVVGVYDRSQMRVYINGRLEGSIAATGVIPTNTLPLLIGASQGLSTIWNRFNGSIDEVKIYNRALTAAEVATEAVKPPVSKASTIDLNALGLVKEWTFDNGDLGGATNSGSIAADDRLARANFARFFDGVDDRVVVSASATLSSLTARDAVTMEAWVYPTGLGNAGGGGTHQNSGIIINKEGEYEMARFGDGKIYYAIATEGGRGWRWISTNYDAKENVWTHLVLTYSASSKIVTLYANGQIVYSEAPYSGSSTIGDVTPTLNEFQIGARQSAVQHFKGRIDTVRIYNTALSVGQVSELYTTETTPVQGSSVTSGLVGEWKFDEGTGTAAADSSGNRNTAILQGGISWVDGVKQKAAQLNGTNGFIEKSYDTTNPLFNITNKLTYALWVKPQKKMDVLIGRQQCDNAWPSAELSLGGTAPNFAVDFLLNYQHNNTYTTFISPAVVPENQWSHVAATYDKDAELVKIYVNGEEVLTKDYNKTIWKPTTSLWIGGIPKPVFDPACWENYGNGSVDDVKIYNRALSAEEIAELAKREVVMGFGEYASFGGSSGSASASANVNVPTIEAEPIQLDFYGKDDDVNEQRKIIKLKMSDGSQFNASVVKTKDQPWLRHELNKR